MLIHEGSDPIRKGRVSIAVTCGLGCLQRNGRFPFVAKLCSATDWIRVAEQNVHLIARKGDACDSLNRHGEWSVRARRARRVRRAVGHRPTVVATIV